MRDERTPRFVTEQIRQIPSLEWPFRAADAIEDAIARAMSLQWDKPEAQCHNWRTRQFALVAYTLLRGQQPADVDWGRFEQDLGDVFWAFDAKDF